MGKIKEPFVQIPVRIIKTKDLDIYDKMVIIFLAAYLPKSFPGIKIIIERLGISKGRILKSIQSLEKKHVLTAYERLLYGDNPEPSLH